MAEVEKNDLIARTQKAEGEVTLKTKPIDLEPLAVLLTRRAERIVRRIGELGKLHTTANGALVDDLAAQITRLNQLSKIMQNLLTIQSIYNKPDSLADWAEMLQPGPGDVAVKQ